MVQITTNDYYFLVDEFPKLKERTLRGEVLKAYQRVEEVLTGKNTTPDCSCRYRTYKENVLRLYDKWLKANT